MWWAKALVGLARALVSNLIPFLKVILRSRTSLIAENLFLRKQLAFYQEHQLKPQPLTDAARWSLVLWSRLFEWRSPLVIVKPDTPDRLASQRFSNGSGAASLAQADHLFEIRELIVRMANENPTWGQRRVAAELYLKLGIPVSPRTVRKN